MTSRSATEIKIVCGGQTGVDRGALEAAVATGIEYGGWCPAGGWAEDRAVPPGVRADYPRLAETPSADPAERTEWNVRDSDLTLVFVDQEGLAASPGTALTVRLAGACGRRCRIVNVDAADALGEVMAWLPNTGAPVTLNVAGPRESEAPGIQAKVRHLLATVIGQMLDAQVAPRWPKGRGVSATLRWIGRWTSTG